MEILNTRRREMLWLRLSVIRNFDLVWLRHDFNSVDSLDAQEDSMNPNVQQ
jgi:hypothetical protein